MLKITPGICGSTSAFIMSRNAVNESHKRHVDGKTVLGTHLAQSQRGELVGGRVGNPKRWQDPGEGFHVENGISAPHREDDAMESRGPTR